MIAALFAKRAAIQRNVPHFHGKSATILELQRFTRRHTFRKCGAHGRYKLASNLSACHSTGTNFIPLVAETMGGLAEDTIHTVRSIGRAITDRAGSPDPAITSRHLFGRLAIALWRGNASLWLHRHPTLPRLWTG